MVLLPVQRELSVGNPIRVPPHYRAEEGSALRMVVLVVAASVVKAQNNVFHLALAVRNFDGDQGASIGDDLYLRFFVFQRVQIDRSTVRQFAAASLRDFRLRARGIYDPERQHERQHNLFVIFHRSSLATHSMSLANICKTYPNGWFQRLRRGNFRPQEKGVHGGYTGNSEGG